MTEQHHPMLIWAKGDDAYASYVPATETPAELVVHVSSDPTRPASYETDPLIGFTVSTNGKWIVYTRIDEASPAHVLATGHMEHPAATVDDMGDITCVCGNTPSAAGHAFCDRAGRECEPGQDWPGTYRCNGCFRIINGTTGAVVGVAAA